MEAGVSGGEEVGVERDDDVRLLDAVHRVHRLSEGRDHARAERIAVDGVVLEPLRLRIELEQVAHLRGHRGRGDALGQEADASSAQRFLRYERLADGTEERAPGFYVPDVLDSLRAIGIVESEDGSLRKNVTAAERRGMVRVPFHLRRPAFITL